MLTAKKPEISRPLAEDGYPAAGLACVAEVVAVSRLSRSKVYEMLTSGELPSVRFGKSRRIRWTDIRRLFL